MESRAVRAGGVALTTTVVAGIGAAAIYVWSKHLSSIRRDMTNDAFDGEIDVSYFMKFSIEVETLRKEVNELKYGLKDPGRRSPTKVRPRALDAIQLGSGDGETLAKDNRYRRGGSYQSLLSDGEYADAEEEWEHEEGEEAIHVTDPQDASTPLPPVLTSYHLDLIASHRTSSFKKVTPETLRCNFSPYDHVFSRGTHVFYE
nr:unnamed protein product [Haemonchus contortus]